MEKKVYLVLLVMVLINGCYPNKQSTQLKSKLTINHTETIEFQDWLKYNPANKYKSIEEQVNTYNIERTLISEHNDLSSDEINKINFFAELHSLKKAEKIIKNQISKDTIPDQSIVEKKFIQLKNIERKPLRVRLYQIFKRYPSDADLHTKLELKQQMQVIKNKATDVDQFKSLAVAESQSQSRFRNGLVGNVTKGILDPDLESIVFKMKPGEVSEVIEGKNGLILFYCENIIPAIVKTDDELWEMAKSQVRKWTFKNRWQNLKLKSTKNTMDNVLNNQQIKWLQSQSSGKATRSDNSNKDVLKYLETYQFQLDLKNMLTQEQLNDIDSTMYYYQQKQLSDQIMLKMINQKLTAISENELIDYYEKNKDQFKNTVAYDLSGIAISYENKNRKKAYETMVGIHERITNNIVSFESAAKLNSIHSSTYPNGNLGEISRKELPGKLGIEILKATLELEPGQISDLIDDTNNKIWLIRLNHIVKPVQKPFDQVRHLIEVQIGQKKIENIKRNIEYQLLN